MQHLVAHALIEAAKLYAISAHRRIDHRRKYNSQPYEVHLQAVAQLVATVTDDPEMLAAAWLHDIVEDTEVTLEDLKRDFGDNVAYLVYELTDISRPDDGNRATRKSIDRRHLSASSARAQTIKLADLCDNALDISRFDPKFARVFLGEMQELMDTLTQGDLRLMARARKIHARCSKMIERHHTQTPTVSDAGNVDATQLLAVKRIMNPFSAKDLARPLTAGSPVTLDPDQIVDASDSLATVVFVLTRHDIAYVSTAGRVDGQLTRSDMERPIGRMWLFGMLTLIELDFTQRVRALFPAGQWQELLSTGRLQKALELQSERIRRNQSVELLDCLQLSDKASILVQIDEQRAEWGFRSKRIAQAAFRDLETLRNHLVHSQKIVDDLWHQIARMVRRFDEALAEHDKPRSNAQQAP